MNGLPGILYKDLRAVLLECGPFDDQDRDRLTALFDDHQLRPWRHSIPEGRSKLARVEAIITFLYNKPFDKPNPLLRFLRVLAERTFEPGCRGQLVHVSGELARQLGEPVVEVERAAEPPPPANGERQKANAALLAALMEAFPTTRELERMVALQMNLNLHGIVSNGNLEQVTFELIRWAGSTDRLPELVQGARRQNPTNRTLAEVAARFDVD